MSVAEAAGRAAPRSRNSPTWAPELVAQVRAELAGLPGLVTEHAVDALKAVLADLAAGPALVLRAGDRADQLGPNRYLVNAAGTPRTGMVAYAASRAATTISRSVRGSPTPSTRGWRTSGRRFVTHSACSRAVTTPRSTTSPFRWPRRSSLH